MRNSIILLIASICICSCSNSVANSEYNVTRNLPVTANGNIGNHIEEPLALQPTETPNVDTSKSKNLVDIRVDSYEDKKLTNSFFFRNGLLVKEISYSEKGKKIQDEVNYFYKKNGEFDHSKTIRPKTSKEDDLETDESFGKIFGDFVVQRDFLKEKGIEFPLPALATEDISYISQVFSVAENYHDFKTETRADGSQKVIRFINFNKKIRFEPTIIEEIVGNNPIMIKDYEIILENKFPLKELWNTDNGDLTKIYSYKNGNLVSIEYHFTNSENQTNSFTERFEYHKL